MKVAYNKKLTNSGTETQKEVPPLPLIPDDDVSGDSTEKGNARSTSHKLFYDPAAAAAGTADVPKYSFSVKDVDGTQSVQAHLNWKIDLESVIAGMNVIGATHRDNIVKQLCKGTALMAYRAKNDQMVTVGRHGDQCGSHICYSPRDTSGVRSMQGCCKNRNAVSRHYRDVCGHRTGRCSRSSLSLQCA